MPQWLDSDMADVLRRLSALENGAKKQEGTAFVDGAKKQEKQEAGGIKKCIKKVTDYFVYFVNPKFLNYNRPFFLATTIGFMTVFVLYLFLRRKLDKKTNCTLQFTQPFVQNPFALTRFKASNPGFDCILGLSHLIGDSNVLCHRMDDLDDVAWGMDQHFDYCEPSVQEQFFPEAKISTLHWDQKNETACKQQVQKHGGIWNDGSGPDEAKGGKWFQHCAAVLEKCMGGAGHVSHIWYRKCPDTFVTIGAVLGYAGYIELVFTVIVILPLMACNFINEEGLATTNMKEWVTQMVDPQALRVGKEGQAQVHAA